MWNASWPPYGRRVPTSQAGHLQQCVTIAAHDQASECQKLDLEASSHHPYRPWGCDEHFNSHPIVSTGMPGSATGNLVRHVWGASATNHPARKSG